MVYTSVPAYVAKLSASILIELYQDSEVTAFAWWGKGYSSSPLEVSNVVLNFYVGYYIDY